MITNSDCVTFVLLSIFFLISPQTQLFKAVEFNVNAQTRFLDCEV